MPHLTDLWLEYTVSVPESPNEAILSINIVPLTEGRGQVDYLRCNAEMRERTAAGEEAADLFSRVRSFTQVLETTTKPETYEIPGQRVTHAYRLPNWRFTSGQPRFIHAWFEHPLVPNQWRQVPMEGWSDAQKRLFDSIQGTIHRIGWQEVRKKLGAPATDSTRRPTVFISYRVGREEFAEQFARRLGQEGILPWYDRWEIAAGDSIPEKIEDAFGGSMAFIPIITADYSQGRWATDEMRTAIVKRIDQGYRIIPVLLDACDPPELIRQLRYVDFSDRDAESFESRMGEIIDAIFGLVQNPFR